MILFLSLISLLLIISLLFSFFPTISAIVLDIDGNTIRNSGSYYIIPKGRGGGLTITQKAGEPSCPGYITRKPSAKDGLPTTVSVLVRTLFVPTSSPVFFAFNTNLSTCTAPQGWNVVIDSTTGRLYVVSGGSFGFPVLFTIEEARTKKATYKIRYCSSCEEERNCGYLGFFKGDGLMGIIDENPLVVAFKKVNTHKGLSEI